MVFTGFKIFNLLSSIQLNVKLYPFLNCKQNKKRTGGKVTSQTNLFHKNEMVLLKWDGKPVGHIWPNYRQWFPSPLELRPLIYNCKPWRNRNTISICFAFGRTANGNAQDFGVGGGGITLWQVTGGHASLRICQRYKGSPDIPTHTVF